MGTKKFNESESNYKKTKRWKFVAYMYQNATTFEECKKTVQYIIDSGMFRPGMPADVQYYEKERWVFEFKYRLLRSALAEINQMASTEADYASLVKLSLMSPFWKGSSWYYDNDVDSHFIAKLRDLATSFDSFCLLYQYDAETDSADYLGKLTELAITDEQKTQLKELIELVGDRKKTTHMYDGFRLIKGIRVVSPFGFF